MYEAIINPSDISERFKWSLHKVVSEHVRFGRDALQMRRRDMISHFH